MIECETVTRKWGNSIGLIIPKNVAEKSHLKENKKLRIIIIEESPIKRTFGMLKEWKKPTKQIIKEMRVGSWDE